MYIQNVPKVGISSVVHSKHIDPANIDVVDNDIDVFVMGHDWEGKFDFLKDYCEVVYLPRTEGISTSKIKKDLGINGQKKED